MAKLERIIHINNEDFTELVSEGEITIGNVTYIYDDSGSTEYIIDDPSAPEYADTAGYATAAGTANISTSAESDINGVQFIENYLKKAEEISYSALVSKVQNDSLIPNQWYRIIDYITTTTQSNTQSAGHAFDIVVMAVATNKLDPKAKAVLHNGDTYFSANGNKCNLTKWEIWYDIANDTSRYSWADTTNGKGVIYRLIDEWGNDCPYDFKNILFTVTGQTANAYTFNVYTNSTCSDHSLNGQYCYGNVMKPYYASGVQNLNFNMFYNTSSTADCYSNTFGNNCYSNTFGNDCYSNTFGNSCYSNNFGYTCQYNIFGNDCNSNTLGNICFSNTFVDYCRSNTLGFSCYSNTFEYGGYLNKFGNYCYSNTFGYFCEHNTFGNYCRSNTLGNDCDHITFGISSNNTEVGQNYYRYNIIENGNQFIRLYQTNGTPGDNNQLQNVYIAQGVNNTTTYINISTIARNLSYRTTVAKLSNGTIRIYKEDEDDINVKPDWNAASGTNAEILNKPTIPSTAADVNAIPTSEKGAASGVAELDSTGKVPSSQLPSYVDDVLEYGSQSAFPATGESGKIYIAQDTNKTYRWSGSAYVEISESLALGETSSTAYRGDRGKTAYDHSQVTDGSNPHNTTFANIASTPTTLAGYGITDAASLSHSHGDITSDGKIQTTGVNISSSDKLVVVTSSNSRIKKTNIGFDTTNTSNFLRQDGTWANPSEILWCEYNSRTNTMSGLTVEQMLQAIDNNKVICCKEGDQVYICTTTVDGPSLDYIIFANLCGSVLAYTGPDSPTTSVLGPYIDFIAYSSANQTWGRNSIEIQSALPSITGNAGKVLTVNSGATGTEWATPTSSLAGLSDTTITSASNGQVLTYDNTTSKWVNANVPTELPAATSSDAGKFVTVNSSGSYVLETVANAELIQY